MLGGSKEGVVPACLAKPLQGATLSRQLVDVPHQRGALVGDRKLANPGGSEGFHEIVDVPVPRKVRYLKGAALVLDTCAPDEEGSYLSVGARDLVAVLLHGLEVGVIFHGVFLRFDLVLCSFR